MTEKLGYQADYIAKVKASLEAKRNQLIQEEEKISAQLMMLKESLGRTEEDIKMTETE